MTLAPTKPHVLLVVARYYADIVDELTRAYGGRLTLAESELGGLKAVLELPAAEA